MQRDDLFDIALMAFNRLIDSEQRQRQHIEITIDNAKDCVNGYISGKLMGKKTPDGKRKFRRVRNHPEIYEIGYAVGFQEAAAEREQREFILPSHFEKVRECYLGFICGKSQALRGNSHPGFYSSQSQSYMTGYDVGYALQLDQMLQPNNRGLKRQRVSVQKQTELEIASPKKKMRLEEVMIDGVITLTIENAADCAMAYLSGSLAARNGSEPADKRRKGKYQKEEEKTDFYQLVYQQGYQDQLTKIRAEPLEMNLMVINIRDCVAGFQAGRTQAKKGPPAITFIDKVTGIERSPSYIAGYQVAFSRAVTKALDDFEEEKADREEKREVIEQEREPERITVLRRMSIYPPPVTQFPSFSAQLEQIQLPVPGRD